MNVSTLFIVQALTNERARNYETTSNQSFFRRLSCPAEDLNSCPPLIRSTRRSVQIAISPVLVFRLGMVLNREVGPSSCHLTAVGVLISTGGNLRGGAHMGWSRVICSWLWERGLPKEYWMIYRGSGSLGRCMIWLLPHPLPSPVSKLDRRGATHCKTKKGIQLGDQKGG